MLFKDDIKKVSYGEGVLWSLMQPPKKLEGMEMRIGDRVNKNQLEVIVIPPQGIPYIISKEQ